MRPFALMLLVACGDPEEFADTTDTHEPADTTDDTNDARTVDFAADVQPLFDDHCTSCHQTHGYITPTLEEPAEILDGATRYCEDGELPFVVPGDPDASFLVYKIGGGGQHDPDGRSCRQLMPSREDGKSLMDLDPDAVATIRTWIAEGARAD